MWSYVSIIHGVLRFRVQGLHSGGLVGADIGKGIVRSSQGLGFFELEF